MPLRYLILDAGRREKRGPPGSEDLTEAIQIPKLGSAIDRPARTILKLPEQESLSEVLDNFQVLKLRGCYVSVQGF